MSDFLDIVNGGALLAAVNKLMVPNHIPTSQTNKYLQKKQERKNDIHKQDKHVPNT